MKHYWRYSVSTTRITGSRWASSKARAAIGNTAPCTNTSRSSSKSGIRSATSRSKSLPPAFITDFELFLRVEKNHCNNTVWSYMMPFRKIIYMAVNNGLLQRDPFFAYSITKGDQTGFSDPRGNHTPDQRHIQKKSYELIRDLFIFCTFTGLSWTDMANLTKANLRTSLTGICGSTRTARKQASKRISGCWTLPDTSSRNTTAWPKGTNCCQFPCYANCKNGIKAIAKKCGIEKNVTWHQSRHIELPLSLNLNRLQRLVS